MQFAISLFLRRVRPCIGIQNGFCEIGYVQSGGLKSLAR